MVRVVGVPGFGQQNKGESILRSEWAPALRDGIWIAGAGQIADTLTDDRVGMAFYGDVFRRPGRRLTADPILTAEDLDPFEQDLLMAWWEETARTDPSVLAPDARTLAVPTPRGTQTALRALSMSKTFAGLPERTLLRDLRQIRDYIDDQNIRHEARQRVALAVREDTRVLVGHSLGSVVAYEALCANPEWPVRMLVTLGSPLGIPGLIFDRLEPAPARSPSDGSGPRGWWPGSVRAWVNIADIGDAVALVKDLRVGFGPRVESRLINNGANAHDAKRYLTAVETGQAILAGLDGPPTDIARGGG